MAQQGDSLDQLRTVLRQRLESLSRAGVRDLPRSAVAVESDVGTTQLVNNQSACVDESGATRGNHATLPAAPDEDASSNPCETSAMPQPSRTQVVHELQSIQQEVAMCTLCAELAATRTQTVFGVGDPNARLCFLGEAPGADEDRLGEPFVGRAGKLLTDIIEKGMGLRRDDVYILNILKCRPPGNRNPTSVEAGNCRGFLDRQLELIQPEFICCLGTIAAQNLLDTTMSIGKMRGQFYRYGEARVIATYHPAYLLRNPSAKRLVWEDIQLLMREMDIAPSK